MKERRAINPFTFLLWLYALQLVLFTAIRISDHYANRYVAVPKGLTELSAPDSEKVSIQSRITGTALVPGIGGFLCVLYVLGDGLESSELVISHDDWRYCRNMEVRDMEALYTRRRGDMLELINATTDEVRFTIHRPGFNFADAGH